MPQQDYFRFEHDRTLGLICSPACNVVYAHKGKYAVCGALEGVYVWNIRTGEVVQKCLDTNNKAEVLVIAASPTDEDTFAVGYADGSIRLWNVKNGSLGLVFNGHKNQITALSFDPTGSRLASGGRDNDIIIWDLVSEMGLYRLSGHSGSINGLFFTSSSTALISASKDTLMKVWDLTTQHCIETVVLHHTEITAITGWRDSTRLMTVGTDNKLRFFRVMEQNVLSKMTPGTTEQANVLELLETINRSSNERAMTITLDPSERFVVVLGVDKSVELWKVRNEEEFNKQSGKKSPSWFKHLRYTRLQSKARSVVFTPGWQIKGTLSWKLLASFVDNQIGEVIIPIDNSTELSYPTVLDSLGHRSECKHVAFNLDGSLFATTSKANIKVWNPETGGLVRTIDVEDATIVAFLTDDRGLIIGDSAGQIHLVDLINGEVLDSIKAHNGDVRALCMRPDMKGMMTGGADKNIKFWEFKASKNTIGRKLKMIKTLQMNDEVLVLMYSPDQRYIAVATMDMTIKVFFEDSLKFYLSLYGHKLPVTGMGITPDSKILISISSDKNIKFWSLEFGECRRSIFAHQEAITGIAMIPGTTQLVTCSKDKTLKYWDVDKFQELQKITGHHGEIWALAMNKFGNRLVTVSKDRSVRIWKSSDEMLFPEEERELEMERELEESMTKENNYEQEEKKETSRATLKTIETMKAGERIVECIEAADDERRKWDEYYALKESGTLIPEPTPGAFFLALGRGGDKTPAEFVLAAFERIPLPDIEEALLCLPINALPSLLLYIEQWLQGRRNVVMSARVLDLVLRLFHRSIIANPSLRLQLETIKSLERITLKEFKDILGYNNIAMQIR